MALNFWVSSLFGNRVWEMNVIAVNSVGFTWLWIWDRVIRESTGRRTIVRRQQWSQSFSWRAILTQHYRLCGYSNLVSIVTFFNGTTRQKLVLSTVHLPALWTWSEHKRGNGTPWCTMRAVRESIS